MMKNRCIAQYSFGTNIKMIHATMITMYNSIMILSFFAMFNHFCILTYMNKKKYTEISLVCIS